MGNEAFLTIEQLEASVRRHSNDARDWLARGKAAYVEADKAQSRQAEAEARLAKARADEEQRLNFSESFIPNESDAVRYRYDRKRGVFQMQFRSVDGVWDGSWYDGGFSSPMNDATKMFTLYRTNVHAPWALSDRGALFFSWFKSLAL